MKKKLLKCPRCGKRMFVESIFGSICGACFYEPKRGFSKVEIKSKGKETL